MKSEVHRLDKTRTKTIYEEIPLGIVPESCNYEVHNYSGRNYIYVDGYIWRGYSNYAEEIILRDKSVLLSIEVNTTSIESNPRKDITEIKDFIYRGITLLGNNYGTGMKEACAKIAAI